MPVTFEAPLALYLPLTGGTLSGAVTFSSAITYGGVTFTNAVTGMGRPVLLARQMDENSAKDRRIADLELAANHSTRKVE